MVLVKYSDGSVAKSSNQMQKVMKQLDFYGLGQYSDGSGSRILNSNAESYGTTRLLWSWGNILMALVARSSNQMQKL